MHTYRVMLVLPLLLLFIACALLPAGFRSGTAEPTLSLDEIVQAEIAVDAVLYEADIPLKQLMRLKVGDTLPLEMRADANVTVRCGSVTLTEGRMGRVGDRVAIRIEHDPQAVEIGVQLLYLNIDLPGSRAAQRCVK